MLKKKVCVFAELMTKLKVKFMKVMNFTFLVFQLFRPSEPCLIFYYGPKQIDKVMSVSLLC